MSIVTQNYTFTNVALNDPLDLERFLLNYLPRTTRYSFMTYDVTTNNLVITTREPTYSADTQSIFEDLVSTKYPNPPKEEQWNTEEVEIINENMVPQSESYFSGATAVDGDVVITKNTSLTRNMYYRNLTVNAGKILNANGWRILVTEVLTLHGTISNDGTDASGTIAGVATSPAYTTYLGPGTNGGAGLTVTGYGIAGVTAPYQCSGGVGGAGGRAAVVYTGGAAGAFTGISSADGGLNMLSTMPTAFLGRLFTSNYYIMGGTGGGGGGTIKGTATTVKSGAGGGGGGLVIVAAKTIAGTGIISARGGNGSNATFTATTGSHAGVGGGGGGGGGCVIIIANNEVPDSISLTTAGGSGGLGLAPGKDGEAGTAGNIFKLRV